MVAPPRPDRPDGSRILVFDVNETLLDLRGMDAPFADVFGDATVRGTWFRELLHQMLVTTVTGPYVDFATLGASALEAVASDRGHPLMADAQASILGAMRCLPPHDDVVDALTLLRDAGRRLVALSNGVPDVLHAQLDHAGLTAFFDRIVSADAAGRLKPAPAPYRWTARTLGVETSDLQLVAAHAWDTTGAQRAGCAAAFVRRPGARLCAVDPVPDVVGDDLVDVARQLVATDA